MKFIALLLVLPLTSCSLLEPMSYVVSDPAVQAKATETVNAARPRRSTTRSRPPLRARSSDPLAFTPQIEESPTVDNDYRKGPARVTPKTMIGRRVERRRVECGLTRRELAEAAREPFPSFNRRLVYGDLKAKELVRIAKAIHAPVMWILTGKLETDG
jgi:hypothetical protein